MTEHIISPDDLGDYLQQMIEQLGTDALESGEAAMQDAVDWLLEQIPPMPAQPQQGGWLKDAKASSRGFFFAAVKAGKIPGWKWVEDGHGGHPEGGYARSGHLAQSMTNEVSINKDKGEVVGEVGTNTPYAPWVIGPDYPGETINGETMYQARIHKDRWWQLGDVMDANEDAAWKLFEDAFFKELEARFAKGA